MTSEQFQNALEQSLRRLLSDSNAPEYVLTWKRWDMPSGLPICALRASARRTSDSGFTGWLTPKLPSGGGCNRNSAGGGLRKLEDQVMLVGWPMPRVNSSTEKHEKLKTRSAKNGTNLEAIARLAGWATPKVQTGAYQYASGDHDKPVLNLEGQAALASGTLSTSSTATSQPASRRGAYRNGALNPFLSCWLMGYGVEWFLVGVKALKALRKGQ